MFRADKSNENDKIDTNEKRLIVLFAIIFCVSIGLVGRLFYIQIINGDNLKEEAMSQWFSNIETIEERGTIFDRNNIPLTNKNEDTYLIITSNFKMDKDNLDLITSITGLSNEEFSKEYENGTKKFLVKNYDLEKIKNLLLSYGITTIDIKKRYDENGLASHVIGYINKSKNIGEAGLEKSFDNILKEDRTKKIGAIVDAQNRVIPGFGYIIDEKNPESRKNIVTTLDYDIQSICETVLDQRNYEGSIVVLDSKNGEILSMVSRPNYLQDNISEYLNSNNHEFYNKAIQMAFPPGSIFKIIVAATALENNLVNEEDKFYCKGYEELGNIKIKCHSYEKGGHGELNFLEAFSNSCNSAFIQIGKMVGGESILDMAKKFGLGEKTNINLQEEVKGHLPTLEDVAGPGIGNLSIGQGNLEITPLQAARLTNIVVNNGLDVGVSLIKEIVDDNNRVINRIDNKEIKRVIDSKIANKIKEMMKVVVESGTGNRAKVEGVECGGKTGSAQAVGLQGETVHAWFTGFFLGKQSEYVITIIVEDKGSGGREAAPIFAEIVKEMITLGF